MVVVGVTVGCKPQGPQQRLRLVPDGTTAQKITDRDLQQAAEVLKLRLGGVKGSEVLVAPGGLDVGIPAEVDPNRLAPLWGRRGELEFVLLPTDLEPVDPTKGAEWRDKATGKTLTAREALKRGERAFGSRDLAPESRAKRDSQGGQWQVFVEIKPERAADWRRFTRTHVNRIVAVVLDGEILTAPLIRSEVPARMPLVHDLTREEADDLASLLNSGPLPFTLRLAEPAGATSPGRTPTVPAPSRASR
jgi:preprotein translocase subunit SecD